MASSEDKKNFGMDVTTWCRGRSTARTAFGRILHTISAAPDSRPHRIRNEELGGETFVAARNAEKEGEKRRGLLDIDLNVAPPDDGGSDSPAAAEKKSSSGDERELDFNLKVVDEGCVGNRESRNRIVQAHCSKGGKIEINCFGEDANEIENTTIVTVSEDKMDQEMRKRRWEALLEVADNALRAYEEEHGNKEENLRNRKRGASRGLELGGELHKAAAGAADRKRINTGQRRRSLTEWNDYGEAAAPPPVVRSARGRALAMPNKYRDTVLDAAAVATAEAEFRRHNKSGKSATVAPTKRKSR